MKLELQVCNLELAKRLKELEVKQESQYAWKDVEDNFKKQKPRLVDSRDMSDWTTLDKSGEYKDGEGPWKETFYSAFTVAELGHMLPTYAIPTKYEVASGIGYRWMTKAKDFPTIESSIKEADARAKMLIYLIENKLITV